MITRGYEQLVIMDQAVLEQRAPLLAEVIRVGLTLPGRIKPLYVLIGFEVVRLCVELSKLLCRKKVDAVPMREALKSGMD